jgi:hypothetical protein
VTDYTHGTGSTGTMTIRDVGNGWVEFWLQAGSATFNHNLPWAYVINGSASGWQSFDFQSGGSMQRLGSWYVATSQDVTFKLGSTGTGGLGGPTDFTQHIDRSTVPSPPNLAGPYNIGANSMDVSISPNSDGGAGIDAYNVGYGTDPWNTQYGTGNTGSWTSIGGLAPGTTYYFWASAHNKNGWSGWSNRVSAKTLNVPDPPTTPTFSNVLPTSVTVQTSPNSDNGSAINWWWIGYGTDPNNNQYNAYGGGSPFNIGGLAPGTVYYFWARAQNSVGWGPWSPRGSVRTIAGAYVNVGGAQKLAVPYVNVGGTWKLAQPYVRDSGIWKQTV